jgi:hypothetical protein
VDLLLWGHDLDLPPEEMARRAGLSVQEVEAAYGEIERRRVATRYLHAPAILPEA